MKTTFRLTKIFGIDIDIHFTFFLLLAFFFVFLGWNGLALIVGVFFFVTMHELCHSLVALHYGIKVKKITLLPIGGVAQMAEMPKKPKQELLISLAGPVSNLIVVIVFFYPLYALIGKEALMHPFRVITGQVPYSAELNVFAHIYWINLILAVFNLLPAFPMDGGRVVRALLTYRLGYREATQVAVKLGHIFALFFGYIGLVHGNILLLVIAVFIYMSASGEGMQVDIQETIKNYTIRNVLADDFIHLGDDTSLGKILEIMFHSHQEDFPVIEEGRMIGFVTRRIVVHAAHERSKDVSCREIMRTDIPSISAGTGLDQVQKLMRKYQTTAMPVEDSGNIVGIVTLDDINRVYVTMSERG